MIKSSYEVMTVPAIKVHVSDFQPVTFKIEERTIKILQ